MIASPWIYALSWGVYCTAWTYFGSVGRAAAGGIWFLPIYLGPTVAMLLAWIVLRKMVRIAQSYRITSIADFIAGMTDSYASEMAQEMTGRSSPV